MDYDDELSGIFDSTTGSGLKISDPSRVIAGRYEIIERVAGGGMGQVVRARHLRLEKIFAIKLMQAEFTQEPEARAVFIREATLASRLSHPNIVSVVDFGDDPDWGPFIVMEFVEGEPLSDRIARDGPLPTYVVCDVAEQLIAAIGHSHDNDVVHGDIKAENVSCLGDVLGDQRHWTVSLVDFGMAHLASTGRRAERLGGTPAYMAPERITGGPPVPSVDIYAFGILMYEMLAGALPFQHEDPEALLRLHLSGTAAPLAEVRAEPLDDALTALVERAMARDPSQRYQSAGELAADLSAYMRINGLPQRHRGRRMATAGAADGLTEQSASDVPTNRAHAALTVFDSLGIAAAGLDAEGVIVIANDRIARLLGFADIGETEGVSVHDTTLGRVPSLRDDLRVVAMDGKHVRRGVSASSSGGKKIRLRLVLSPASGGGGVSCSLALYQLKKP